MLKHKLRDGFKLLHICGLISFLWTTGCATFEVGSHAESVKEIDTSAAWCRTVTNGLKVINCPDLEPRGLFYNFRHDIPEALQEFTPLEKFALSEETTNVRAEIINARLRGKKGLGWSTDHPLYDAWVKKLDQLLVNGTLNTRIYFLDGYLKIIHRDVIIERVIDSLNFELIFHLDCGRFDEAVLIEMMDRRNRVSALLDGGSCEDLEENCGFLNTSVDKVIDAFESGDISSESLQTIQQLMQSRIDSMKPSLLGCVDTEEAISMALLSHFQSDRQTLLKTFAVLLRMGPSGYPELEKKLNQYDIEADRSLSISVYERIRKLVDLEYYDAHPIAKKEENNCGKLLKKNERGSAVMTLQHPYEIITSTYRENADVSQKMMGLCLLLQKMAGGPDATAISPLSGDTLRAVQTLRVGVTLESKEKGIRHLENFSVELVR